MQSLLSILIWLPIVGGFAVLALGTHRAKGARWLALAVAIVTFIVSIQLLTGYDAAAGTMQFIEQHRWIAAINANYHLGVDGISVALIVLTTFVTVLVILGAWDSVHDKVNQYLAAFLVLEGLMVGVFCALDALLFYVFFEGMLIPMFIIIGIWGGPRRVYATLKFFLYTFFGSIFMLVGLIYLYTQSNSWELSQLAALKLTLEQQSWLFFAFLIAFAVKVPMWPVHTWLPDAHVEAPTGGSVILAAIMLKIGGYGFLRFSLPITPDASQHFAWLLIALSLVAVIYVGFVALVQEDMKKLIAYSSVSHMGFVTLGIFISLALVRVGGNKDAAYLGVSGAMVQMISHGFVSGAMFSCVGVIYDRMHTRMIKDYGGVVNTMPWYAAFVVLFAMANCGLPGTSGFVGEFMVILASFQSNFWIAALAAFTLIIGAAYTLWLVKRVIWGDVTNDHVAKLKDINAREALVLGTFAAATLLFGIWPAPLTHLMDASIKHIVDQLLIVKVG
ncbi:MAG: NADH-quinone oxidoreductase subunit M [Rudaea sp.]|uniref:NADH-quinone oxidoreductase subunit M n=1 Tax=unclassified Rudaea TaxID=2627037 RepID=UPI001485833C|nr:MULTISPECIES: NADH-quinone oxidoreductase subunit M [unclassified Rudaea]MBN8884731.1 NADH-quinone oxidoreductase subunit M [Rudaea sp.]MBR0344346.1 NADH-quinone oxidoreductase subunit M [Rudaea sp.]